MTRVAFFVLVGMLLVLGPQLAVGQQGPDAYFHEAAKHYIDEDLPAARRAVNQGLEVAPSDPRLLALRRKIEASRRRSSDDGNSEGQGRRANSDSDTGQSTPSADSESRSRSKPDGQDPSGTREGEQEQRASADGKQTPGRQGDGSRAATAGERRPAGTLSQAQAERLLRALEVQEQRLLRSLQRTNGSPPAVEKDW